METILGSDPAGSTSAHERASAPRMVFLVGFMGAGKTSVGKALAQLLGWMFEDLDERIVAQEGRPVEQIFRESGEPEFRRVEHAALRALLADADLTCRIVALGGGAFVQAENAALLADAGAPAVFLDAPVEILFRRCQHEQEVVRPLRRSREDFARLYESRRPHYERATLRVDTGEHDVKTIALEVAQALALLRNSSNSKG
jgi:shikimate kinase